VGVRDVNGERACHMGCPHAGLRRCAQTHSTVRLDASALAMAAAPPSPILLQSRSNWASGSHRVLMDAVKRVKTLVSLPLCIVTSAWATAGTCSARATARRHIEGKQRGVTEWHPSQSGHVHTRALMPLAQVCAQA